MIAETRSMSKIAQAHGLLLAFEFHRKTLTDTGLSCAAFLGNVGDENVKAMYYLKDIYNAISEVLSLE